MLSTTQPKACNSCRSAKRRCSKQLPKCKRCRLKSLDCAYEHRSPFIFYSADEIRPRSVAQERFPLQPSDDTEVQGENISFGDSAIGVLGAVGEPSDDQQITQNCYVVAPSIKDLHSAWFLTEAAWGILPIPPVQGREVPNSVLKNYIATIQSWLREWVDTGTNPFIHSHLYKSHLPRCIRNVFTTLSSYLSRTPATEDMILWIISEQTDELVQQHIQRDMSTSIDTLGHISRVQTLLVLTIIQLFDGDVRLRCLGEQNLSTLHEWSRQMLDHATREARNGTMLRFNCLGYEHRTGDIATYSNLDHEKLLWDAWILSESVRRTWNTAETLRAIYITMKCGSSDCPGSMMLTTRKGAWEADSAYAWTEVCASRKTGFMHRNDMATVFLESKLEEVDHFSLSVLELDYGAETLKRWGAE